MPWGKDPLAEDVAVQAPPAGGFGGPSQEGAVSPPFPDQATLTAPSPAVPSQPENAFWAKDQLVGSVNPEEDQQIQQFNVAKTNTIWDFASDKALSGEGIDFEKFAPTRSSKVQGIDTPEKAKDAAYRSAFNEWRDKIQEAIPSFNPSEQDFEQFKQAYDHYASRKKQYAKITRLAEYIAKNPGRTTGAFGEDIPRSVARMTDMERAFLGKEVERLGGPDAAQGVLGKTGEAFSRGLIGAGEKFKKVGSWALATKEQEKAIIAFADVTNQSFGKSPLASEDDPWYKRGFYGVVQMFPHLVASTVAGAATGGLGVGAYWWTQGAAEMNDSMRQHGIDEKYSKPIAALAAIPYAAVMELKLEKILPGLAPGAQEVVAKTIAGQLGKLGFSAAKKEAHFLGLTTAQSIIDTSAKALGTYLDKNAPDMNWQEELDHWKESMKGALEQSPFLLGPGLAVEGVQARDVAKYRARAEAFAKENPELAALIAQQEVPSRQMFKRLGLGDVTNEGQRKAFAEELRRQGVKMPDVQTAQEAPVAPETAPPAPESAPAEIAPQTPTAEAPAPAAKQGPTIMDRFRKEQRPLLEKRLAGDERVRIVNRHHVTDMIEGKAANLRLTELAIENHDPNVPVVYAEGDLKNLGGMNKRFGQHGADLHFKAMADIVRQEVEKLGGDMALTTKGGDEFGFTFKGIPKEKIDAALDAARARVEQYVKENGLEDVAHTKEGRQGGTGINFATEQFDPAIHQPADLPVMENGEQVLKHFTTAEMFQKAADQKLELAKEANDNVQRGTPEAPGPAAPEGQAAGVEKGAVQAPEANAPGGQPVPEVQREATPPEDLTQVPRKDLFKRARELGHKPSAAIPNAKLIELIQQGAKPKEESNVRRSLRKNADEGADADVGAKAQGQEKEVKPPTRQLPKVGEKVRVNPKDDLNGSKRRKAVYGPLQRIEEVNGKKFAVVKADGQEWIVPVEKAERMAGRVAKEEEAARMAKEYTPKQLKQIEKASSDARILASRYVADLEGEVRRKHILDPQKNLTAAANAELQGKIDAFLKQHMGMEGDGRDAQAKTLPFVLEAVMGEAEKGTTLPKLKSVEFVGSVGQGDTITLGGQQWKVVKEAEGGRITLQNEAGDKIGFYRNYVPIDKGTQRVRGEKKAEMRSKQPRPEVAPKVTETPEPAQPSELKTSAKVVNETDLLGQERARVEGAGGETEQGQMFDNEVSPELARERKLREAHRQAGGKELDFGDMAEEPGLPEKPNDDIPFYDPGKDPFQIPVQMEPNAKPIGNHEIIRTLEREFDVPIRTGRVAGRPLGYYKAFDELIRMKGKFAGDLGVATHEVAHHIDKMTDLSESVPGELRRELGKLDYDPNKQRVHEGWAEFVRHLLTEDDAQKLAPNFYKWFQDEWLPTHPHFAQKLAQSKEFINRWRAQGAEARVQAALSWDGEPAKPLGLTKGEWIGEKLRDTWTRFKGAWVDNKEWLKQAEDFARKNGWSPKPGQSASEYIDTMSQIGPSLARTAIEHGVFSIGKQMDKIGPSLREAFAEIPKEKYKEFVAWAYARHAREAWAKGKNPGISKIDADYLYEKHNSPTYEKAADTITRFNNGLIEMLAGAKVITHQEADRMIEYYKTYLPTMRVMDKVGNRMGLGASNILDLGSPVFGRKGSGLQVLDPVVATMERATRFYTRAVQQQAIERVVGMAKKTPGMGRWITQVSPHMVKSTFSAGEALRQIGEMFQMDFEDLPKKLQGVMLEVYKPLLKGKRSEAVARLISGDRTTLWQFDPDLYRAISGMNQLELPKFLDLTIGAGARLVRLGATGINPNFIAPNIVRDYMGYLFQRKESKGPGALIDPPKMMGAYLWSEIQRLQGKEQNPYVELFKEFGGEMGLSVGLDRKNIAAGAADLLRNSTGERVIDIMKSPVESLRSAVSFSEVGPRLAEFVSVMDKRGYSQERLAKMRSMGQRPPTSVIVEAMNAAHDVTINFKRGGYLGMYVNRMIPFFNASIQGSDKFVRTWKDNPKRTMLYAGALAASSLLYYSAKKDEDWYKEAPPWLKYGFWTMTDADGKPIARIPRPFEWGWTISAGIEALANAINQRDPKIISDYLGQFAQTMTPNFKPALITPAVEAIFNWDTFRNAPLVGPDLENRKPEDQYHSYNTELMRQVGKLIGVSPAKLEHLVEGVTGGMYGRVARPTEAAIKGEKLPAEAFGTSGFELRRDYSQTTEDFYRARTEATQTYNSSKDKNAIDPKQKAEYKRYEEIAGLMSKLREGVKDVKDRDERFTHEKYMIGLARWAMHKEPLERYPNLLTSDTKDMPEEVKAIRDEYMGRLAFRLSTPLPKREHGESLVHFQERREKYKESVEQAASLIADLDVSEQEWLALMRAEAKRRGYTTKAWNGDQRSAYGERLWRLRRAVND